MSLPRASIALFRHPDEPKKLWLAVWDPRGNYFDFVTAERLESEPWWECLDREIAGTLNLRRGKDYIICSMARLHVDLPPSSPGFSREEPGDQELKYSAVEFCVVGLYGQARITPSPTTISCTGLAAKKSCPAEPPTVVQAPASWCSC